VSLGSSGVDGALEFDGAADDFCTGGAAAGFDSDGPAAKPAGAAAGCELCGAKVILCGAEVVASVCPSFADAADDFKFDGAGAGFALDGPAAKPAGVADNCERLNSCHCSSCASRAARVAAVGFQLCEAAAGFAFGGAAIISATAATKLPGANDGFVLCRAAADFAFDAAAVSAGFAGAADGFDICGAAFDCARDGDTGLSFLRLDASKVGLAAAGLACDGTGAAGSVDFFGAVDCDMNSDV
jgi:hypothetical protein